MEIANFDALDNGIIRLLTDNGRMSIGEMAKKLNVTAPTVRNRLKVSTCAVRNMSIVAMSY